MNWSLASTSATSPPLAASNTYRTPQALSAVARARKVSANDLFSRLAMDATLCGDSVTTTKAEACPDAASRSVSLWWLWV